MNVRHAIIGLVALACSSGLARADLLCGALSGTLTTVGSPHVATCDISVASATTLDIDPGVVIELQAGVSFTVDGTLNTNGVSGNSVRFRSAAAAPDAGDWGALLVNGVANLQDTIVQHGQGTRVTGSLTALDCIFEQCTTGLAAVAGSIDVRQCVFNGNTNDGLVIAEAPTSVIVDACDFANNDVAVLLEQDAYATLTNLTAFGHRPHDGIVVAGPTWRQSGTWTDAGLAYVVSDDLTFTSGSTLTLDPGVVVKADETFVRPTLAFDGLDANGTPAEPVVFTSLLDDTVAGDTNGDGGLSAPDRGDWNLLVLQGTADLQDTIVRYGQGTQVTGSLTALDCIFEQCSTGLAALSGTADVRQCAFNGNEIDGLVIAAAPTSVIVDACNFANNDVAVLLEQDAYAALTNLTAFGHRRHDGIVVAGPTWRQSGTWTDAGLAYVVSDDLTFTSGSTLTLDPGVVVKADETFVRPTLAFDGLDANGTPAEPVVFTSLLDDTVAGDTNGDGGLSAPDRGDWNLLVLQGTADLQDTIVRYGQGTQVTGSLTALDCIFEQCSTGLAALSGTADVRQCAFSGNEIDGLVIAAAPTSVVVDACNFANNDMAVLLEQDAYAALTNLTAFGHRRHDGIVVAGPTWRQSGTWTDAGLAYVVSDDLTFTSGSTLTLDPGVVVKADETFVRPTLAFDGLDANGTAAEPVVFTSLLDDTVAGDTNGDGGLTAPDRGDWNLLVLQGTADLQDTVVRYGQGTQVTGSLTALDCIFEQCSTGLAALAGSLDVRQCAFNGNEIDGLVIAEAPTSVVVDACNFANNDMAVLLEQDAYAALTNLTAFGHRRHDGIVVAGPTWRQSGTWTDAGLAYVVSDDLTFTSGSTLTLDPGVVVKADETFVRPTLAFDGLTASGTPAEPVVFTSLLDDTVAGDTNGDGGASAPSPRDWNELLLTGTADLTDTLVRHGQATRVTGSLRAASCGFEQCATGLIADPGSTTDVTLSAFDGNTIVGVRVQPGSSSTRFDSCDFQGNEVAVVLEADGHAMLLNLTASGQRLHDGIILGGPTWSSSGTLTAAGLAYVLEESVTFDAPLALEPGVVVKADYLPPAGPLSFTSLSAVGTAGQPIVFTSLLDDTAAGDTNADGSATSPARGDWPGIRLSSSGPHDAEWVTVAHAVDAVSIDGTDVRFSDGRLVHSDRGMVFSNGAGGVVTGTLFHDDSTGVFVDETSLPDLGDLNDADTTNDGANLFSCNLFHVENLNAATVMAEANWWGSAPPEPLLVVGPVDRDPHVDVGGRPGAQDLRLARVGAADVEATWMDATVTCSYRVFRSEAPDAGFADVAGPLTDATFVDAGVARDGRTYYYQVIID